jgi:LmbE family N-acetylglucosaminyl deacetylase
LLAALVLPAGASSRERVLWIAAHPDDEVLAAAVLGDLCVQRGNDCTLLVLTRGEAGHCLLPAGCAPSLATVRRRELRQAAELLHARVTQWALPDGGGLDGRWDAAAGGHDALLARLRDLVAALAPTRVLIFDPRHGTTCHGDHRRAGQLALEAVQSASSTARVDLLETVASITSQPFTATFVPAAPPPSAGIRRYPVTASLWSFVWRIAAIHRSQFPPDAPAFLRQLRGGRRAVFTAPAAAALASDQVFRCE